MRLRRKLFLSSFFLPENKKTLYHTKISQKNNNCKKKTLIGFGNDTLTFSDEYYRIPSVNEYVFWLSKTKYFFGILKELDFKL